MSAPTSSPRHPAPCGQACAACRHRPGAEVAGLEGAALVLPAAAVFVVPVLSAVAGAHLGEAWLDSSYLSQLIGGASGFLTGVLMARLVLLVTGARRRRPVVPTGGEDGGAGEPDASAEGQEIS